MSRKTVEAENDFRNAARKFRGNVAADPTTFNKDIRFIQNNQEATADDLAIVADGLQKLAAAIRDVYDVCARIEANQKKAAGVPSGGAGSGARFPSTP
jgi:hypothetical protein